MLHKVVLFCTTLLSSVAATGGYYQHNITRTTIAGIAEYRSALTLDWLAAEDLRQKQLAVAFQTESAAPLQMLASECISYEKPAPGKVARLMLELLKNLEGDDGHIIPELIQALVRSNLLVETSLLEQEPDLDALVETPGVMMGAPHDTFPRVLALAWTSATDTTSTEKTGWCSINKITKYISTSRPVHIASHLRTLDQVLARARFIMEEFIQHVIPNMYDKSLLDKQGRPTVEFKRVTPTQAPEAPSRSTLASENSFHLENVRSYNIERSSAENNGEIASGTIGRKCSTFLLLAVFVFDINFLV